MSHTPRLAGLFRLPECWIFLFAFGLRILILSRFAADSPPLPPSDDMKFYADWAVRISQGEWSQGTAFYGLPGYAFCLAATFSVFGFDQVFVGAIQAFFEALTSVLIFKIASEVFQTAQKRETPPQIIGTLAAVGWVLYQPAQTFSTILMPTAWLVLAFWGCVWWTVSRRKTSPWAWLAIGLFTGLVALMVATILFLVPLFAAAIWWTIAPESPWKQRLRPAAAALLLLVAGVFIGAAPAWGHNYFYARDPVLLSAHSGLNFWMGNNPDANGYPKIPDGLSAGQEGLLRDSILRAEEAAGRKLPRSEVSKFWSAKADAWIHEHRGAWLSLLGVKLRNFWNAFQYDDLSEITLLADRGILTPGLRFGAVAAFALPGMFFAIWGAPRARWVAAAVLLHMAALLPVFVTERYRLCAVPGLLIFAAYLIWTLWDALARAKWLHATGQCAALGVATWFVSIPQSDPSLWALDPFNTGLKHLRAGRLPLAQERLERAYALVPDNAEINFGLGNLWFTKGDIDRARSFYRRTLELLPKHPSALTNLGRVETMRGDFQAAETALRAAIERDPQAVKPLLFLAESRLAAGDPGGAQAALDQALALRPGQPELLELEARIKAAAVPAH